MITTRVYLVLTFVIYVSSEYFQPSRGSKKNLVTLQKVKKTPIECILLCNLEERCYVSSMKEDFCVLFAKTTQQNEIISQVFLNHVIIKPKTNPRQLKRGSIVGRINVLSKTWSVSLDIIPLGTVATWANILHFTVGDDITRNGDRIPAVWFPGGTTRLHISSSLNNNINYYYDYGIPLPLAIPTRLQIMQRPVNETYRYSIYIGNENVFSISNQHPAEFNDVIIYVSDPWYPAANILVKNFQYTNGYTS